MHSGVGVGAAVAGATIGSGGNGASHVVPQPKASTSWPSAGTLGLRFNFTGRINFGLIRCAAGRKISATSFSRVFVFQSGWRQTYARSSVSHPIPNSVWHSAIVRTPASNLWSYLLNAISSLGTKLLVPSLVSKQSWEMTKVDDG